MHQNASLSAQERLVLAFSQKQGPARQQRCVCAAAGTDYRQRDNGDIRVLVVGATGYIGKFVVKELIKRGYNVVAFAREKSGVGGKAGMEDTKQVLHQLSAVWSTPKLLQPWQFGCFQNHLRTPWPHLLHTCHLAANTNSMTACATCRNLTAQMCALEVWQTWRP